MVRADVHILMVEREDSRDLGEQALVFGHHTSEHAGPANKDVATWANFLTKRARLENERGRS